MSNKMLRAGVFFYTIFLHVLVFLVSRLEHVLCSDTIQLTLRGFLLGLQALYKAAYSHEVKRDIYAECQNQFAQHMLEVHGENMEHHHFGN